MIFRWWKGADEWRRFHSAHAEEDVVSSISLFCSANARQRDELKTRYFSDFSFLICPLFAVLINIPCKYCISNVDETRTLAWSTWLLLLLFFTSNTDVCKLPSAKSEEFDKACRCLRARQNLTKIVIIVDSHFNRCRSSDVLLWLRRNQRFVSHSMFSLSIKYDWQIRRAHYAKKTTTIFACTEASFVVFFFFFFYRTRSFVLGKSIFFSASVKHINYTAFLGRVSAIIRAAWWETTKFVWVTRPSLGCRSPFIIEIKMHKSTDVFVRESSAHPSDSWMSAKCQFDRFTKDSREQNWEEKKWRD